MGEVVQQPDASHRVARDALETQVEDPTPEVGEISSPVSRGLAARSPSWRTSRRNRRRAVRCSVTAVDRAREMASELRCGAGVPRRRRPLQRGPLAEAHACAGFADTTLTLSDTN